MKTIYKNGTPVKYSFTSADGGVDKCFELMAGDSSLIHVESYKDNECKVAHVIKPASDIVVQSGTLKLSKPFTVNGTLKILSGAALYLADTLTIGYGSQAGVVAGSENLFEVYDGATLIIDNCSLKALYGANLKIHKYAIVQFVNSGAGLKAVDTAVVAYDGKAKATDGTVTADWTKVQANVDSDYVDPAAFVALINGDNSSKDAGYTYVTEAKELTDAAAIVDAINGTVI